MDFVTLLGSVWPDGNFWANIIRLFDVGSYAWTIILFTAVLKLVLTPLDFVQKFVTNKQTRAQAKIQPELDKLKKRYGQNVNLLYQKQNELYKKHNIKPTGSCLVMLIYMVVTCSVFLTLFGSLQSIASFNIKNQYHELQNTFYASYGEDYLKGYLGYSQEDYDKYRETSANEEEKENKEITMDAYITRKAGEIYNSSEVASKPELDTDEKKQEYAKKVVSDEELKQREIAQIKVVTRYKEIKDSFVWIKNIWKMDNPLVKEIATFNDYKVNDSSVTEEEYNLVMAKLLDNYDNSNQVNGYYILSVIVVLVCLLSQFIIRWVSKPKGKNGEEAQQLQGVAKVLMFVMPLLMLSFTLSSSAIFAIYIITSSLTTTIITPITTIICNKIEDKIELEKEQKIKVDYRR